MRTVAVANHKGGSAKTTTTVNLAAALGELGQRVLVIDMDPQGSATSWLGAVDADYGVIDAILGRASLGHLVYETTAPGVGIVPASPQLVTTNSAGETEVALGFMRAMERLPAIWDTVLVDCPPSLGYLGVAPLAACQETLVPVEAHVLALAGITSLLETMARIQVRLNPRLRLSAVLACRVNRTTHARAVTERLERRFPEAFMRAQIRESIRLAEAPSFRLPITKYSPSSAGAEDYRAAALEFAAVDGVREPAPTVVVDASAPSMRAPSRLGRLIGVRGADHR